MDTGRHLDLLAAEGARLIEAAGRAGLGAPVPSCPPWRVRDLLAHLGYVHRWAATVVAEARTAPPDQVLEADILAEGPGGDEVLGWFADGHRALVDTLTSAPESLACWSFLPAPSPRAFWARRQAHETAVHRADVELAAGAVTAFDAELAADGVDELIMGFAPTPRSKARPPQPSTLLVRTTDTDDAWRIRFGPDGVETRRAAGPADAVVTAPASDLYLLLWNRPPSATPAVSGDGDLLELWHQSLTVRWGGGATARG